MINHLELLTKARDLILDPKCWTTRAYARDSNTDPVRPADPKATCWCAVGVLDKVRYDANEEHVVISELRTILEKDKACYPSLISFNDASRHSEVIALFDRTIKKLRD